MDPDEFDINMSLDGCVQMYHPLRPHVFYVIEQKLENGSFLPMTQGAHVFFIDERKPYAHQDTYDTLESVRRFVDDKILMEGWRCMDDDRHMDIRKKHFVKWQLCHRIY